MTDSRMVGIDAGGTNVRIGLSHVASDHAMTPLVIPASEDGGPEPLQALSDWSCYEPDKTVSVVAGITKVSRAGVVERWEQALLRLFPHAKVQVVPDFQIAFHGAVPGGVGVAALAGTGSVMYGENALGESARVGGRGWEYGDEGSGTWLTTEAIRRTIRAMDSIDGLSPLYTVICGHLGESSDAGRLAEAARRETLSRGRGFLVPLIADQARQGDAEAINLFVGAAGWIGAQVRTTLQRLTFDSGSPVTIARVGGLWDVGPLMTEPFAQVMARWYPHAAIIREDASPLIGALRLTEKGLLTR